MTNSQRGIIEFKSGDQAYKMKIDMNALCELEELLDKGIGEIIGILGSNKFRVGVLRALFFVGMRSFHNVTLTDVGQILSDMDGDAMAIAEKAVEAAFPEAKESPKKPAARTRKTA